VLLCRFRWQVDGIDMVGGMKEFNHEIKDAQHLGKVKLTIERVLVKGVYVPPKPKVHKNGASLHVV